MDALVHDRSGGHTCALNCVCLLQGGISGRLKCNLVFKVFLFFVCVLGDVESSWKRMRTLSLWLALAATSPVVSLWFFKSCSCFKQNQNSQASGEKNLMQNMIAKNNQL